MVNLSLLHSPHKEEKAQDAMVLLFAIDGRRCRFCEEKRGKKWKKIRKRSRGCERAGQSLRGVSQGNVWRMYKSSGLKKKNVP
jgi:hypothetical protein